MRQKSWINFRRNFFSNAALWRLKNSQATRDDSFINLRTFSISSASNTNSKSGLPISPPTLTHRPQTWFNRKDIVAISEILNCPMIGKNLWRDNFHETGFMSRRQTINIMQIRDGSTTKTLNIQMRWDKLVGECRPKRDSQYSQVVKLSVITIASANISHNSKSLMTYGWVSGINK